MRPTPSVRARLLVFWLHAACTGCLLFDATTRPAEVTAAPMVATGPEWTVRRASGFIDAENDILRLRFACGADSSQGWFRGGGGQDGGVVELYYKPTSETRNLVFRNGTWGGQKDNMDYFEAEPSAQDQSDFNTPELASGTHALLLHCDVHENAGRLIAQSEFEFASWLMRRTYFVYPWGDITQHVQLTLKEPGSWGYLGHRISYAVSQYDFVNGDKTYRWGGTYQDDGERFYAWSDGHVPGSTTDGDHYRYSEIIRDQVDSNTAIQMFGRSDPYSGFLIDDENGSDPDIVVFNGDSATAFSPFDEVSRVVGGSNYVETGIFSPTWAPNRETHAGITWFYRTIPCCPPDYASPMLWPSSLGTWNESFHIMLRTDLVPDDYLALWRSRARDLARQAPYDVVNAHAYLNDTTRVYHLVAEPGAQEIRFRWSRPNDAKRAIDYRTVFVLENMSDVTWAAIEGDGPEIQAYHDPTRATTVVVLVGAQPARPQSYLITVGRAH